jgi:hypothetical protein
VNFLKIMNLTLALTWTRLRDAGHAWRHRAIINSIEYVMKPVLVSTFLLVAVLATSSYCSDLDYTKLENKYDHVIEHFVGAESVKTTYYKLMLETKTDKLSEISLKQYKNALNVYKNPDDKKIKEKFLNEFPNDFDSFLSVFHQKDFSQLYENSFIYLDLLADLSKEYPEKTIHLLLNLSKNAKYDADATGNLQNILTHFIINNYYIFIKPFKKLPKLNQENIAAFIADVETIATYREYNSILEHLNKNREFALVEIFSRAKVERIKRGH